MMHRCALIAALAAGVSVAANSASADHEGAEPRSFIVDHTGGGVFLFAAIVLGIATRSAGSWIKLPYTVVLLVRMNLSSLNACHRHNIYESRS
jgi:hypothetical protein